MLINQKGKTMKKANSNNGFSMSEKAVSTLKSRNSKSGSGKISTILEYILSLSDDERLQGVSAKQVGIALSITSKQVRNNFRSKLNLGTTDKYDVINLKVEFNGQSYACLLNRDNTIKYFLVKNQKELVSVAKRFNLPI